MEKAINMHGKALRFFTKWLAVIDCSHIPTSFFLSFFLISFFFIHFASSECSEYPRYRYCICNLCCESTPSSHILMMLLFSSASTSRFHHLPKFPSFSSFSLSHLLLSFFSFLFFLFFHSHFHLCSRQKSSIINFIALYICMKKRWKKLCYVENIKQNVTARENFHENFSPSVHLSLLLLYNTALLSMLQKYNRAFIFFTFLTWNKK